jgi:subtilase family serine protease
MHAVFYFSRNSLAHGIQHCSAGCRIFQNSYIFVTRPLVTWEMDLFHAFIYALSVEEPLRKYITSPTCSIALIVAFTFFTWCSAVSPVAMAAPAAKAAATPAISWQRACSITTKSGIDFCNALVAYNAKTNTTINPLANAPGTSAPYGPSNFHTAYNLPTTASGTPTVALVDAYNDPNAASDLATYRSHYGLPACTTASGCLKIENQTGGTTLPSSNSGWGLEISLDLDMVSAICENCHILLVEASSASDAALGTGVNTAVSAGAVAVSNSYGGSGTTSYCNSYFSHTYVAITASSGDSGLGIEYPAACEYVTAVGGTTLNSSGSETKWSDAGGGCSSEAKPSYEVASVTSCSKRAVTDVSADADPNTGAEVYDSYGYSGYLEVGGTSESSPITAAVYALAGNATSTQYPASLPWAHYASGCLFKVSSVTYSYQGGLGSPDGTSCF